MFALKLKRIVYRALFSVFFLAIHQASWGMVDSCENGRIVNSQSKTTILFVNGIFNTLAEACESSARLISVLPEEAAKYNFSYIWNPNSWLDIAELMDQEIISGDAAGAVITSNQGVFDKHKYYLRLGEFYQRRIQDSSDTRSIIIFTRALYNKMEDLLAQGQSIVVVPHSQGNHMIEAAYSIFEYLASIDASKQWKLNKIRVVGLASVAHTTPNDKYVTIAEDGALASFEILLLAGGSPFGHPLERNYTVCTSFLDFSCRESVRLAHLKAHGFQEIYLNAFLKDAILDESLKDIAVRLVKAAARELEYTSAFGASSCSASISYAPFSEDFVNPISSSKWSFFIPIGSQAISGGGKISMLSVGPSFPLVEAVAPSIPQTGDFSFFCKARYTQFGASGAGACMISDLAANGGGSTNIGVWGDSGGSIVSAGFSGPAVSGGGGGFVKTYPNDLAAHDYEFCVIGNTLTTYRDRALINTTALPNGWVRPSKLWLGHQQHSASDWVRFENQGVEIRKLSSISNTNTIQVPAASESGATYTNSTSTQQRCTFTASGSWSGETLANGSPSPFDADGHRLSDGYFYTYGSTPLPTANAYALIARKGSGGWTFAGSSWQTMLAAGESVQFIMNDTIGAFYNNSGALSVAPNCQVIQGLYTKISNAGSVLPDTAVLGGAPNDWACTMENANGNIWEVKTESGLSAFNRVFTYYTSINEAQKFEVLNGINTYSAPTAAELASPDNAPVFIAEANIRRLCGRSNWSFGNPVRAFGCAPWGCAGIGVSFPADLFGPSSPVNWWTGGIGYSCPYGGCFEPQSAYGSYISNPYQACYGGCNTTRSNKLSVWRMSAPQ